GCQRRLRGTRVEREKQLAPGDALALREVRRLDKAAGARPDLDALGGLEATGEFVPVRDVLLERGRDRYLRRRRRGGRGLAGRAGGECCSGNGCAEEQFQVVMHIRAPGE